MFGVPDFSRPSKSENKTDHKKIKRKYLQSFATEDTVNAPKNLLLIYDIPELKKKERDWFRRQLISLGFIMIQRSVWVGPSPLPSDFLNYLKSINIKKNITTFKLTKPYKN